MRRLFPILLALALPHVARATTLDPSHPVWAAPNTDVSAWMSALEGARAEQAQPQVAAIALAVQQVEEDMCGVVGVGERAYAHARPQRSLSRFRSDT